MLARAAGCARFTYNWALAEWEKQYKNGEKPSALKLKKKFNSIKEQNFPCGTLRENWVVELGTEMVYTSVHVLGSRYKYVNEIK